LSASLGGSAVHVGEGIGRSSAELSPEMASM
jgi:hypothetical protein